MQPQSQEDPAPCVRWMETIQQTNLNWEGGMWFSLSFFFQEGELKSFLITAYSNDRIVIYHLVVIWHMFTPLPFPISSFILIVCFTPLSCSPLGINSSCLSAPGYQHTWGCRERDSVNVHTVYLRHYPAVTLPNPRLPHCLLFTPLCICDFPVFY